MLLLTLPIVRCCALLALLGVANFSWAQAPVVTMTPSSPVTPGTAVELKVTYSGIPTAIRWTRNREPIPGANTDTLLLPAVTVQQAGLYTAEVSYPNSTWSPLPASVAVIGDHPAAGDRVWALTSNSDTYTGGSFVLSVEGATMGFNLPIQWYHKGEALVGRTNQVLIVDPANSTHAGTYHAVVDGHVSSPVTMTIDAQRLEFAHQPKDQWGEIGWSANFGFSVSRFSYPWSTQWYRNGVLVPGATISSLNIHPITEADFGQYFARVTTPVGTFDTRVVNLWLRKPPTITRHPASQTVAVGGTVTIDVAVANDADLEPFSFQWRKDGVDLPGATQNPLVLSNAQESQAGMYGVRVTGRRGHETSTAAAVTIGFNTPVDGIPAFGSQPKDVEVALGEAAKFEASAAGRGTIGYQWFKDGVAVPGADSSTLLISSVTTQHAGTYTVKATSSYGSATSAPAVLKIKDAPPVTGAPKITRQPTAVITALGETVSFSVAIEAPPPVSITWLKDGKPITGMAAEPQLTIAGVTEAHVGTYSVFVSCPSGTVDSQGASLSLKAPPRIFVEPLDGSVFEGQSLVLQVLAEGNPAPTYQWFLNQQPIAAATSATHLISHASTASAGNYQVVVTNVHGTVTSRSATVAVSPQFAHAGIYFGEIGASPAAGVFAVVVRPDRTAYLIGYLAGSQVGFVASFGLMADGSFIINEEAMRIFGGIATARGVTHRSGKRALTGQIAQGALTATWETAGQTLTGERANDSGPASSQAGYYTGGTLNASGELTYSIVAADGRILVLNTNANGAVGATGLLDSQGNFVAQSPSAGGPSVSGSVGNGGISGTVTTGGATKAIGGSEAGAQRADRLINISTRGVAGGDNDPMIAGFVIHGSAKKKVLIRAVGPTLRDLGIVGSAEHLSIRLVQNDATLLTNERWDQADAPLFGTVGAFPLAEGSKDAVVVATLDPGAYTALVASRGATGISLVEVYELPDASGSSERPRLSNISTRGFVGQGDHVLIGGFAIRGPHPKRLLIRGIGPSLAHFGVPGALPTPVLTVYREAQELARNEGWGGDEQVATLGSRAGAFELENSSRDAALVITLPAGNYTAVLHGAANATGRALIEIYELSD